MSALQLACQGQSAHFIRELLGAGAHTDLPSRDGWEQTALHIAAACADSFPTGVRMLVAAGADPTLTRVDGKTATDLAPAGSRIQRELGLAARK